MAVFETWLDQDLKKPVRIQYLSGNLFSQDNMGNLIGVNVTDDGAPATLGGSVSANVIRADGATVAVDTGVLSGNKASVTLPQAAYAVPGVITVVIKITSGTDVTTLAAVVTTVYRSSTDTIVDPGTIIPSIQALISQIETAVASIPSDYSSLWTTLAPAYSTSATYAVGQYVTYNGGLYRCTTAITSAESWTAAHWTAAKVGNDLSDLKSAMVYKIGDRSSNLYDLDNIVTGQYYKKDGTTGSSASFCTVKVDVGDYDRITYNGITAVGSDNVVSCFFNSSDEFLSYFKQATGKNTIEVPENAKYVGFSIDYSQTVLQSFTVIGESDGDIQTNIVGMISSNLYNIAGINNNHYYKTDGTIGDSVAFATIKLDIEKYTELVYSGISYTGSDAVVSCWFKSDDTLISSFRQNTGVNSITVPKLAKYVGITISNNSGTLNDFVIVGAKGFIYSNLLKIQSEIAEKNPLITKLNLKVGAEQESGIYDYQIRENGKQDVIWSWWTRPACVHFKGVRDRIYYGFTSQNGFTGVGMYDCDSGLTEKTLLMKGNVDDHNALCVMVMPNRRVMVAYPGGHNSSNGMFIRISKYAEDISEWEEPINLPGDSVSYAQLIFANNKYWLFYRSTIYKWNYRVSSNGTTWSNERSLVSCSEQYYALFVPTSDASKIRFCCTANPTYTDINVRMGFIDTVTEAVYNADCETVVRASDADLATPIANTTFSVIISAPQTGTLRLFDVLRDDATSDVHILFTIFSDETDSIYYLYNNGTTVELCNGGKSLWDPKYQLGASFISDSEIVIARNETSTNTDIVEIAEYDGTIIKSIFSELNGTIPIRNARPVCSPDGRAIVWQRGYYNSANYTDFDMDACLYYDEKLIV